MANVLFKRGLSKDLPLETYAAQDGVFYLTTDTNRLYVGNQDNKLAEINRYVKTVDTKDDLPSTNPQPGDFVYIIEGNMLAVYLEDNEGNKWIQVNSQDASTDMYTSGIAFDEGEENENGTATTFTLTLSRQQKDVNGNTTNLTDLTTSIDIPIINIDTAYEIHENSVLIKTTGNGASESGAGVTIAGGNGITISEESEEVIISGKSYELALEDTSFYLKDENQTAGASIEIIGDNDWVEVSKDTSDGENPTDGNKNKIKIRHTSKDVTEDDTKTQALSDKTSIPVITGLTVDDNNHVTGIEKTTLTAENTTYTVETSIGNTDENKGKLIVGLKDQDNNSVTATPLDISFTVDIDGTGAQNILPGSSLGSIYSKGEMDRKFSALNAMTYMGVANSESELPTTGSKGDTYKVGKEFSMVIGDEEVSLKVGDLLILNGTEIDNIVSTPDWDRIESGEAADTTYVLGASDDSQSGVSPAILLTDSHGNAQTLNFVDDNIVNVSTKNQEISITHGKVKTGEEGTEGVQETTGADTTLDAGGSLSVITTIVANDYGHVETVETTEFTLPAGDEIVADDQEVSLTFKDGNGTNQGSIKITAGDELDVTAEATESTETGDLTAIISHKKIVSNDTGDTGTEDTTDNPSYGGSFDVVKSVTYNDYGHVSDVQITTVTLPDEITYEITAPSIGENKDSVTWELKDSNKTTTGSIQLVSKSITFTTDTTNIETTNTGTSNTDTSNVISMELTWGEF